MKQWYSIWRSLEVGLHSIICFTTFDQRLCLTCVHMARERERGPKVPPKNKVTHGLAKGRFHLTLIRLLLYAPSCELWPLTIFDHTPIQPHHTIPFQCLWSLAVGDSNGTLYKHQCVTSFYTLVPLVLFCSDISSIRINLRARRFIFRNQFLKYDIIKEMPRRSWWKGIIRQNS